jgi:hypothetical protein
MCKEIEFVIEARQSASGTSQTSVRISRDAQLYPWRPAVGCTGARPSRPRRASFACRGRSALAIPPAGRRCSAAAPRGHGAAAAVRRRTGRRPGAAAVAGISSSRSGVARVDSAVGLKTVPSRWRRRHAINPSQSGRSEPETTRQVGLSESIRVKALWLRAQQRAMAVSHWQSPR